ncbi:MAG: taurine dioxygenase [Rhodospirillaceae bacterium]|nr:taurine dioxygenase [Magnetovibrio sp.]MAY66478.1 taurine dioxygenase [Rhodospirillaceae bacterium]
MTIQKKPLGTLGVEITGVDVGRDLSGGNGDNLFGEIRQAWQEAGGLMVIRDQSIDQQQHIDFSRRFGPLFHDEGQPPLQDTVSRYLHPDYPQIYRVSNKVDDKGQPTGRKGAGTYWHSDVSFRDRPAMASVLYAIQIPPYGGDTIFADMAAAYDALSDGMKAMLAGLNAVHDFAVAAATQYAKPVVIDKDFDGANQCLHPIVRTHADTGRKSLYVNPGFTSHIEGFTVEESRPILDHLYRHATQPEFLYRHAWQPHDLLVWDNRTLMHYAVSDYSADRYMERTTVIGERPV